MTIVSFPKTFHWKGLMNPHPYSCMVVGNMTELGIRVEI